MADQAVTVTSTDESIIVEAQNRITLQAGQSSITLDGSNITFACPGNFSVKGASHPFGSGGSDSASLDCLPTGIAQASVPKMPLETVYSQALDFSDIPQDWLPVTVGMTTIAKANGELLTSMSRAENELYAGDLLTKKATDVDYWVSTGSSWKIGEEYQQPDDQEDSDGEIENE